MELKDSQDNEIVSININKEKQAWDLRIKKTKLETWIKEGVDEQKKIKIVIAERNFQVKERNFDKNG